MSETYQEEVFCVDLSASKMRTLANIHVTHI